MSRSHRTRAFTLVEILVALTVLLIFVGIIWKLASGWMRSSTAGIWRQETSHAQQRAMTVIRQAVEKACLPAAITPEGTTVARAEDNLLHLGKGTSYSGDAPWDKEDWSAKADAKTTLFEGETSETRTLMTFVQGTPGYERVAGMPKRPVSGKTVRLVLRPKMTDGRHQKVFYKRAKKRYPCVYDLVLVTSSPKTVPVESLKEDTAFADATGGSTTVLVTDVAEAIVWAEDIPGGKTGPEAPVPVGLKILCINPNGGGSTLPSRIIAQPKCGVIAP